MSSDRTRQLRAAAALTRSRLSMSTVMSPDRTRQLRACSSVSFGVLECHGDFSRVASAEQGNPTGEACFKYEYAQGSFSPAWASPLWETLDLPLESEPQRIQRLLDELGMRMPATPLREQRLSDAGVPLYASERWAIQRLQATNPQPSCASPFSAGNLHWFDWLIRGRGLWILSFALLAADADGHLLLLWPLEPQNQAPRQTTWLVNYRLSAQNASSPIPGRGIKNGCDSQLCFSGHLQQQQQVHILFLSANRW